MGINVNFSELKESTIKNTARAAVIEVLRNMLEAEFGAGVVSQVGFGEFAICVGEAPNGNEICVSLKVSAKDFENRQTAKKSFTAYDRHAAAQDYNEKVDEAAAKKAEAEDKKAAKIKRDNEMRAKKDAEKEKEKANLVDFEESEKDDMPF